MISPEEIKYQALKWWKPFLQTTIAGEQFFPKVIERIGKVKSAHITQRFKSLQQEIELLYRYSKNQLGTGYVVKTTGKNFRRTGSHELPDAVVFETIEDYLIFTGKSKEWSLFQANYEKITTSIPGVNTWVLEHCLCLTDKYINWTDVLKVCHYFINNPRPDLYLRQLPISIHTKFIEENVSVIQSFLDFLIPDHIRDVNQRRFAERYFLRYDEPLIRIRFLDNRLLFYNAFSDISIPLSDFEKFDTEAKCVLITENKMTFLTLPPVAHTIAVWSGGGFNISFLKNAVWLLGKDIFYWGDIDEHGFQILNQLRHYYPKVKSIMMDRETFEQFNRFAVDGPRSKADNLGLLTKEEKELFMLLKDLNSKNRLEQEKISQLYLNNYLKSVIFGL